MLDLTQRLSDAAPASPSVNQVLQEENEWEDIAGRPALNL
jgi:hypothetical protein